VVVKSRRAHIKASGVRRLTKTEPLTVEMMAELVTECAQERPKRRHLLAHCGPRPDANQSGSGRVIAEKLCGPTALPDSQRARSERTHIWFRDSVEFCTDYQELRTRTLDGGSGPILHG
jgi:hypothetical protein